MWISVEKQQPCEKWLREHHYGNGAVLAYGSGFLEVCRLYAWPAQNQERPYTHWMPIPLIERQPGEREATVLCALQLPELKSDEAAIVRAFTAGMGYVQIAITEKLAEILAAREGA